MYIKDYKSDCSYLLHKNAAFTPLSGKKGKSTFSASLSIHETELSRGGGRAERGRVGDGYALSQESQAGKPQ